MFDMVHVFSFGDGPCTEVDSLTLARMTDVELGAIAAAHDIAIEELRQQQTSVRIEMAFARGGESEADEVYRAAIDRYGRAFACRALLLWEQRDRIICGQVEAE